MFVLGVIIKRLAADFVPYHAHDRCEGGEAGADYPDVGFDAGPDEDGAHGPGCVGRVDEVVEVYQADDGGNADAEGEAVSNPPLMLVVDRRKDSQRSKHE